MITVYPAIAALPTNAAKESGGNLAALTALIEIQTLMLGELRAINLQLASATGQTISGTELADERAAGYTN